MESKQFENSSSYAKYDADGDGIVTDQELAVMKEVSEIERADRKQKQQRYMAWTAIWSMVLFTLILFSPVISDSRVNALADLLGLFYIAQAGVVGAFMGVSAWMSKK